jgi:hypothetical protein
MLFQIAERLHEQMHKLPGMPPHSEAARLNQNLGARHLCSHNHILHPAQDGRHAAMRSPNRHHGRPPRVLVAWQQWIGGLFSARRDRG